MKKIFFIVILFILMLFFNIRINASDNYLLAENYIRASETSDCTNQFKNFLNKCKTEGKDALFGDRVYLLSDGITLPSEVSIYGSENTIFRGNEENGQVNINGNISNVTIKNIIFDNVTLYLGNTTSTNIVVENNIFMNAKKVDISINSGLSSSYEGYYVLLTNVKNSKVNSNIFLRDDNSLGRGISVYKTTNIEIKDNYFGQIEDLENSIVSDETKNLFNKISGSLDLTLDQGNFMTCINVLNSDTNVSILGNHFSINTDLIELNYEKDKTDPNFYHRDHIIYAKQYNKLYVVGNYFKGMNMNQDGGVKFRDGYNLLVHKNIFDQSLLLLYVQNNNSYFKQTEVSNNIFINRFYTDEVLNYSVSNKSYTKNITVSFLILFYNYYTNAVVEDFTIENNLITSAGLENEYINVGAASGNTCNINGFYLNNNKNILNEDIKENIYRTNAQYDLEDTKFTIDKSNYDINVYDLLCNDSLDYHIENKKIVYDGTIYLNNLLYSDESLELGKTYQTLFVGSKLETILIDNPVSDGSFINKEYELNTYSLININLNYDVNPINMSLYNDLDISEVIPNYYLFDQIEISSSNIIDFVDGKFIANKVGNEDITINLSGFVVVINFNVTSIDTNPTIKLEDKLENLTLNDSYSFNINCNPETLKYALELSYDSSSLEVSLVDGKLNVKGLKVGSNEIVIKYKYDDSIFLKYEFNVISPTTDIEVIESIDLYVGDIYQIVPKIYPLDSTDTLNYVSSNNNIVTVDENGNLTVIGIGKASITVKSGDISKEVLINVVSNIKEISTSESSYEIDIKCSEFFIDVIVSPNVSNPNLAIELGEDGIVFCVVSDGKLKLIPLKEGSVKITIYDAYNSNTYCDVNVVVNVNSNPNTGCNGGINYSIYSISIILSIMVLIKYRKRRCNYGY